MSVMMMLGAASFDPEAATQAYLATLKGAARAKSDAYFEGGYWIPLWGTLISVLIDLLLLKRGWSARFRDWAEAKVKWRFVQSMLWSLPYSLAGLLLALPWTIYSDYVREKQYGLLDQGFGGWAGEQMIGFAINALFSAIAVAAIMAGVRKSPKHWWVWGTGFATALIAFIVLLTPVFFNPLFNTYSELKAGPVRDRIVAMANTYHVPSDHIYVFDQSKQHKRVSANVSGIGPTIRISLNDNLLNRTTLPQTASVMGHELGHYVLGHMWKLLLAFAAIFAVAFFLASRIVPALVARYGASWGVRGIDDVAAFPIYSIVIALFLLLITPIQNSIVRFNESEADAFGLDAAREPDGFAQAAMQLSEYRKIEPTALEEILFYDHPSGRTRVRMSMEWKAKHLAEVVEKD